MGQAIEFGRVAAGEVLDADAVLEHAFEEERQPGFEAGEAVGDFSEKGLPVDEAEVLAAFDVESGGS